MAETNVKKLKGKVLHKHELEVDWQKSSYIPDKGELIVYDAEVDKDNNILELPEGRDTPYTCPRVKFGDGERTVNELEFSSGEDNTKVLDMSIMDEMMFEKFGHGEPESEYFFSQANWDHLQIYNRAYVQCYDNENDLRLGDDGKGQYALRAITRFGNGTLPKYPWMKKADWPKKYRANSAKINCYLVDYVLEEIYNSYGLTTEDFYLVGERPSSDSEIIKDSYGAGRVYVYYSGDNLYYFNSDLEGWYFIGTLADRNDDGYILSEIKDETLSDEEIINNHPPIDSDYPNMATIVERMPSGHIRIPKGFSTAQGDPSQLVTSKSYVDDAVATRAVKLARPDDGQSYVYTSNGKGVAAAIQIGTNSAAPNTIPKRTTDGTLRTATPIENLDAANKQYVDAAVAPLSTDISELNIEVDKKLTRKTVQEGDTNRYVYTQSYKQTSDGIELMQIGQNSAPANSIVRRTSTGTIRTTTPSADNDAATKKYVDDLINAHVADSNAHAAMGWISSDDSELGNITTPGTEQLAYELSADGTYYIVTGKGTVTGSEIVIPDTYQGKPIMAIKENAFKNNANITKFTVGKYIMFIAIGNIETWVNCTQLYFTAEFGEDFAQKYQLYTGSEIGHADCGYSPYSETDMYRFIQLGYFSNEDEYIAFNDHIGVNKYQEWLRLYNGGISLDTYEEYSGTGISCSVL